MRRILLNIIMVLTLTLPVMTSAGMAWAAPNPNDCPDPNTDAAKSQALQGIGETGTNCDSSGVNKTINTLVNILAMIVGAVGIIMVILAGFKYLTSGGDSTRVANAKSTLIYALIGIAIAALAEVLVHFVLFQTNKVGS